jgi:hypothetical protein
MLPLLCSCKWSEHDDILKSGTTIDDDDKRATHTSTSMDIYMWRRTFDMIISIFPFRVCVKLFNVVYIEWIAIKHWMRKCIIDYDGKHSSNELKRLYVL